MLHFSGRWPLLHRRQLHLGPPSAAADASGPRHGLSTAYPSQLVPGRLRRPLSGTGNLQNHRRLVSARQSLSNMLVAASTVAAASSPREGRQRGRHQSNRVVTFNDCCRPHAAPAIVKHACRILSNYAACSSSGVCIWPPSTCAPGIYTARRALATPVVLEGVRAAATGFCMFMQKAQ